MLLYHAIDTLFPHPQLVPNTLQIPFLSYNNHAKCAQSQNLIPLEDYET